MWYDADHSLDQHELGAVMHLVLFDAHNHLNPGLGGRCHAGRVGHGLSQEAVLESIQPGGETIAILLEQPYDLGFGVRLFFLRHDSTKESEEVESFERGTALDSLNLLLKGGSG